MHIVIVTETMPEIHQRFIEFLRSRKYPIESKTKDKNGVPLRTGTHTPFVREIKFYDINVKEACKDNLLSDLKNMTWDGYDDKTPHPNQIGFKEQPAHFTKGKLNKFLWLLSKVTPLKRIDMKKVKPSKMDWQPFGFFYIEVLGALDDPIDEYGEDVL